MRDLIYGAGNLGGPAAGAIMVPAMASAIISQADIGTGSSASGAIHPPGWAGGAHPHHHHRGHLIARQFGGDGNDAQNLVTLTDGTNMSLQSDIESTMRDILESNGAAEVLYEVIVRYVAAEYAAGFAYAYLAPPMPSSLEINIRNIHDNAVLYSHIFTNGVLARHVAAGCCGI